MSGPPRGSTPSLEGQPVLGAAGLQESSTAPGFIIIMFEADLMRHLFINLGFQCCVGFVAGVWQCRGWSDGWPILPLPVSLGSPFVASGFFSARFS